MKTVLKIEITTGKMNKVSEHADGTGKDVTNLVEEELHTRIKYFIKDYIESDRLEEDVLDDPEDAGVDGFEEFDDYGDIKIVMKEEVKEEE